MWMAPRYKDEEKLQKNEKDASKLSNDKKEESKNL